MATFRKRGDKWQARIQRRNQAAITKSFLTKQDAERWARGVERDLDLGVYAPPALPVDKEADKPDLGTLGDLLKRYREEVTPTKRSARHETQWLTHLERDSLAATPLATLTAKAVADYRDRRLKEVTPSTLLRTLQVLSAILNHARREWALPVTNVVSDVRKPAPNKARDRILTPEEEQQLLHALTSGGRDNQGRFIPGTRNPWIAPAVTLALATAMRRGELLALRWENVNLVKRTALLPMTKNGDSRHIPLSPKALEVLSGLPHSEDGRVFPVAANALQKAFTRAREVAGLQDVHFHDLRHCAVTNLARKLPNLIELAAVSGHRDLAMLKRYYHTSPEDLAAKLAA
jgi:integrase